MNIKIVKFQLKKKIDLKVNYNISLLKKINTLIVLLFLISLISCSNSNNYSINSPNNNIQLDFQIENGEAFYSVTKNNKSVIKKSKLGIVLENELNIGKNLEVMNISKNTINNSWNPIFGEFDEIINKYNTFEVELSNGKFSYDIFFRVYDDGVAFKYFVPNQTSISNYNIIDEYTEFNLNSDDTAW